MVQLGICNAPRVVRPGESEQRSLTTGEIVQRRSHRGEALHIANEGTLGSAGGGACARMKAVVRDAYGPPSVLELRELPTPAPAEHEVLVRVRAASVNPADWY